MQHLHLRKETGRWSSNIEKDREVPNNLNNEYRVKTFATFNIPENTEKLFLARRFGWKSGQS